MEEEEEEETVLRRQRRQRQRRRRGKETSCRSGIFLLSPCPLLLPPFAFFPSFSFPSYRSITPTIAIANTASEHRSTGIFSLPISYPVSLACNCNNIETRNDRSVQESTF